MDIIHCHYFLFKTAFQVLDFVSILRWKPPPLGSIDRTSPYLKLRAPSLSSSYIATDWQSASSSWCLAPFGADDEILSFFEWQLLSFFFCLLSHLRLPQPGGSPHPYPPWTGWSSPKSKVTLRLMVSQYMLVSSPRLKIRHQEGYIRVTFLMLPLGGLYVKHAVQHGIWVPTQHLLGIKENHGKPWLSWSVAGPSGCKLTSSQQSRYQHQHKITQNRICKPNTTWTISES
jgi:hypothetical protein